MQCHVFLVLLASLGCLTKVEAEFTFDGPFFNDVLTGGLVDLPCYISTDAKRLVLTAFSGSGINRNSLWWIHRRWNRIVDPWSGDGRRTYLEISVSQSSDGIAESMGIFKIPMVSGVGLRILAANPSDAGQYACLLCKRTFDQGLTVDMKNATLLSIHSIRVTEAKSSGNEEEEEEEEERADAAKTKAIGTHSKKGSKNSDGKGTFFDAWTWQIDSSAFHGPDTTVFKKAQRLINCAIGQFLDSNSRNKKHQSNEPLTFEFAKRIVGSESLVNKLASLQGENYFKQEWFERASQT
ncbi:hypothetical protein TSMEX_004070 [Taenia solium]|eukprot:TsM_001180100 transcript=TsM_001180100 gene=TsM_001180100